ncbi:cobalamin biosynthesis protein CobE [Pseudomonas floridensis]|uniref:Cobalamin biosynthesis protein CobE n=1 Tax=Pseudomonas floridensis TaxID=1958950 RepID=A0A1X0MZH1_9PSED|nr:cobalamin biosynthesis protein [Pseudomonas floridensis]ORC55767.1 cobalamin biosynthesis protein CobE [Pseudomonas floridensis]
MPDCIRPESSAQTAPVMVAGLGCRRGCTAQRLRELLEQHLSARGLDVRAVTALASIDLKSQEPGLLELAGQLAVPLVFFNAAQLVYWDLHLTHRSAQVLQTTGCHGVAEGSALALAAQLGDGSATLLIERQKSSDATFALASSHVPGG